MSRSSMQRLIVRPARLPVIARAVMGGALLVVGFVLLGSPVAPLAGWVPLLLGAVLAGLSLRSMGEERELAVFDDRGATVSGFPVGIIPWSEIRGAELTRVSRTKVLVLDLRHPGRLVDRLPAPRRHLARLSLALGRSPVRLAVSGTDAAPDAVLAFVREKVSRRAVARRAVS
jgi:hypothetical protein